MGITYAGGSITGKTETREYNFLVDTGSTWMTLRQSDIDLLQLAELERVTIDTPTGTIHRRSFKAAGMLEGVAFETRIVPAPIPMVGYELLQRLGFVVDLVIERIELKTNWGNVSS